MIWHWTGNCVVTQQPAGLPPCQHASFEAVTTDAYVPGTLYTPQASEFPDNPTLLKAIYRDDAGGAYPSDTLGGSINFGWPINGMAL